MAAVLDDSVAALTRDLYAHYGSQIHTYCYRRLRSREEAEDAVQTTFLNAFRALQRGTTTHAEQAWLYKIARHVCDARGTISGRRRLAEAPNAFEVAQETIPAPHRETAEELIGLDAALEAMPENQRRAIVLREWRGLSYREIADELGLTQTAVEMLIFRARRSLARGLEAPAAREDRAFASA
jgi:RNA polymerase sigma-70 factor, ECF subfamily